MPDKSDPTTTVNPVPVTPNLPSMDSDVPPPPAPEPTGGAGPTGDLQGFGIPPVITPTKPGRRVNRRMVATILGLFVLVGGLGAGLVLVRQQQDIRKKAALAEPCNICASNKICTKVASVPSCSPELNECVSPGSPCGATATSTPIPPESTPASWGSQCRAQGGECVFETTLCGEEFGTSDCTGGNYKCCKTGTVETPKPPSSCDTAYTQTNRQCVYDNNLCEGSFIGGNGGKQYCYKVKAEWGWTAVSGCACPEGRNVAPGGYCLTSESCTWTGGNYGPGIRCQDAPDPNCQTATNPPENPQYQCQNVKAYNSDWKLLTAEQLSTLKAGDKIRFTISGTATVGAIDKAAFQINGGPDQETSQKKPADPTAKAGVPDEFYIEYTIPAGTTSFNITAKLHHSTLGWF